MNVCKTILAYTEWSNNPLTERCFGTIFKELREEVRAAMKTINSLYDELVIHQHYLPTMHTVVKIHDLIHELKFRRCHESKPLTQAEKPVDMYNQLWYYHRIKEQEDKYISRRSRHSDRLVKSCLKRSQSIG